MTTIRLPLPPDALRVNRISGAHWGTYRRAKTAYKASVLAELGKYTWSDDNMAYPVCMALTAWLGKGQRCDLPDLGSWCKTAIDALVEYGIFRDDSAACIRPLMLDIGRDWANPRLEVTWES